jgi:FKBP-type peptidyl-prolyl cis-trans isomerase 2
MYKKIFVLSAYIALLLLVGCGVPRTIDDADEVKLSYILRLPDGVVVDSGTTTIIIGQQGEGLKAFQDIVIGAQVDEVLTGTITPEEGYGYLYDFSLQQNLAEVYLPSSDTAYEVGDQISLPNVGEGIITDMGLKNGVFKYMIDFNPPETYTDISYELRVLEFLKK